MGRIYVAKEGINAQLSVPAEDFERFEKEIAKGDPKDPETLFVRLMAALKQGKLDEFSRWQKRRARNTKATRKRRRAR